MRIKEITEDEIADMARRATQSKKRRDDNIKATAKRASDADKQRRDNTKSNAQASKAREADRKERQRKTVDEESDITTGDDIKKSIEQIKADQDGRIYDTQ